jgi:alpha-L-rhamnosidase
MTSTDHSSRPNARALDLGATWIGPAEPDGGPDRHRPAYQLARTFTVDGEVREAVLHVTAHGVYEAFVNGERVGDAELTPGWTAYRSRLHVQTFTVTDLVVPGDNVVGALLSDGWWRGQNSGPRRANDYGATTAVLARLEVTFENGSTLVVVSDGSWSSTPSHILAADLIAGEVHDLRQRRPWNQLHAWSAVRVEEPTGEMLVTSAAPAVRRIEELRPVSVRKLAQDRWVVDVGQNICGWVRLTRLGPAGTSVTLTYGEWLDPAGDVTQDHINPPDFRDPGVAPSFQTDTVVSAGRPGEAFEPRHSTKGFQYVRIEGDLEAVDTDDVTAVVVHTDLDRVGSFECSDERINALHRISEWSLRGNVCDIPTDCPTRERAGWTGDWLVRVEAASFLYDVYGFSQKWLRDLAADQRPDGRVGNLVPESHPGDDRFPAIWPLTEGSAGWGDAAVHVPWTLYRARGDATVLSEQYDSARAWVDFAVAAAASGRHPSRVERSPEPAAHEQYLWDTGWHYGEWLEPGEDVDAAIANATVADHASVATAYLSRSSGQLAQMARILGHAEDAERYSHISARSADAWRAEVLDEDGAMTPPTQATYARALHFGLVPDRLRSVAAARLAELVGDAGNHPGTGFLTTPYLLPVLASHGHVDVAYDLLFQEGEPGWLVMLDRGATTVWEEWGGVDADCRPHASLNHFSKGTVIGFLHEYVAGLQIVEPGYRRFRVAPMPGGGITWARVHHESPLGRIEVSWTLRGAQGSIRVTVPTGTTAELLLPDGSRHELEAGTDHRSWSSRPGARVQ